jgi:hypothetical protein
MAWQRKTLQPHNIPENNRIVTFDSEMKFEAWKKRQKLLKPKKPISVQIKRKPPKKNTSK